MQIPWIFALLPSWFLVITPTLGQELDNGGFETWIDVDKASQPQKAPNQGLLAGSSSLASHAGQFINNPAPGALTFPSTKAEEKKQQEKQQKEQAREDKVSALFGSLDDQWEKQYFIRFGAGVSWMIPMRLADMANGERLMSEFSVSWAPAGMIAEIGMDLGIGRDNVFDIKPNLKFFFLSNQWLSVYLEGGCDVMFFEEGREVGAGAGLGFVLGIMENLALEIKASASVFSLSDEGASRLLEFSDELANTQVSNLSIFPSLTARIAARF